MKSNVYGSMADFLWSGGTYFQHNLYINNNMYQQPQPLLYFCGYLMLSGGPNWDDVCKISDFAQFDLKMTFLPSF